MSRKASLQKVAQHLFVPPSCAGDAEMFAKMVVVR
jgi:hypothetical protein